MMLKNFKNKLIILFITALIIAGIVNYVNYLINKPLKILDNPYIPTEFIYNNQKIALAWTDDNTGENLIIQSDKKEYSGFNTADVYFSITNISNKDQEADIVIWLPSEKTKVEKVERINEDGFNFQFSISNFQSISNDQFSNRKDVGGNNNGYAVNDEIKSGETNFYKATIKYPTLSKGEFFIEAFSAQGGYGHLDPWYSSSWSYKRAITLQGSKIATTTDGFPILATTTLADLKTTTNGGKVGNDNGYDIIFVDSDDSTLLNYEREKYASTTGEIAYWIKTDIASSTDKTIYMYYGNAGASDTATTTGVWDDNFVMVNHLAHNGIATTTYPDFLDSTKYANNGSSVNMNSADLVNGQVDGALDFDGVDDKVIFTSTNYGTVHTVSFWINYKDTGSGVIVGGASGNYAPYISSSIGEFYYKANGGTSVYVLHGGLTNGVWYYITVVRNETSVSFYKNSVKRGSTQTLSVNDALTLNTLGSYSDGTVLATMVLDSPRISNTARTAGWITTEYNNQSDVGSFMVFGAEEEGGTLTITTDPKVIITGIESSAFTVQADHNLSNDLTVNLSSDSSGTNYFASTTAGDAVTTVTIPSGASSVNFYYKDYKPGAPTITVSADNFTSDTQQQMVQGVWQNTSFQCRRQITLQGSKIATTTDGFPILATTTLADLKTTTNGGKVGNDNGYDIIFVDSDDSTLLNYEREKYASTTGEIAYWIKTDIASSTDKTIYMYYGNASASDTATTTGVWDDNFVMVNHLAHNGIATTTYPDFNDSTKYANNGSSINMNSADLVNGQVDGALDFDGVDDYVDLGNPTSLIFLNGNLTISMWLKLNSNYTTAQSLITGASTGSTRNPFITTFGYTDNKLEMWRSAAGPTLTSVASISDNNQRHVVFTRSGVSGDWTLKLYINGIFDNSATTIIDPSGDSTTIIAIGRFGGYTSGYKLKGIIDSPRISNTARTAGWITTEYNNQSDVGSFMGIGEEVCLPVPATRSGGENVKTKIKGGVRVKGGSRF